VLHLQFWGKTFSASDQVVEKKNPIYKPVLHHLLDVSAVALVFLRDQPARLSREAKLVSMEPEAYANLVAFLAGLHDLGKFSRNFQAKRADLWPAALGPCPSSSIAGPPHWRATGLMLQTNILNARFRTLFPHLNGYDTCLLAAIAGHHGRPPPSEDTDKSANEALRKRIWLDQQCLDAALFAFETLAQLTGAQPALMFDPDSVALFSWRLAGLITLADWIGSDADYFGPATLEMSLEDYWRHAQCCAHRSLTAKGLWPLNVVPAMSLATIAPRAATSPRPMQRLASDVPLAEGPQLVTIEDATGSGKTEAAILLATRMIAARFGEGLYIALPTMATANAMHARLANMSEKLFETGDGVRRPSLILSHGKSLLASALAELRARPADDGEETTAASCNGWVADDRRRAFFADIGAGTIDQAFLAVLPKKFLALRQYALAGRILIIDEAHSFDSYMKEELGSLLQLHAMNGGSAIVLSATLSAQARQKMAHAFLLGLGHEPRQARRQASTCASQAYPLLTRVSTAGAEERAPGLDAQLVRTVAVERVPDRQAAVRIASQAADRRAAVLVICNAVDEAIKFHAALAALRPNGTVHIFHARFAHGDRLAIEDAVLTRFGREANAIGRAGHVLVATQVVEQSLDLDFDLVISDLAPVDLLIQRAGRLWRHMDLRPAASRPAAGPKLMVVSPDPSVVTRADWLTESLGRSAHVYQHAGIMWRSARTIFGQKAFRVPDDLRPIIEAVYGDRVEPVPAVLQGVEVKGEGKDSAAKTLGRFNVVDLVAGYGALPSDLRCDEEIGTRLGEETVTIRLARREGDSLLPWIRSDGGARLDWALSELRVRRAFWGTAAAADADAALRDAATKDWTEWEREIKIVEVGAAGRLKLDSGNFSYSDARGLEKL
jgi:CRISPR-associated endonuclease/helicase Cas3